MKTILYIRVSTTEQNIARQVDNSYDLTLVDKCSGSIALNKRPEGSKLFALVNSGEVNRIVVSEISRLGRNTLDILTNVQLFTAAGVCVESKREGLVTLQPDGSKNATANLFLSILSGLAEYEREMILERSRDGLAAAKKAGRLTGRKKGSFEDPADYLNKKKPSEVLRYINQGYSHNAISKMARVSFSTILKVRKAAGI